MIPMTLFSQSAKKDVISVLDICFMKENYNIVIIGAAIAQKAHLRTLDAMLITIFYEAALWLAVSVLNI